MAPFPIPRKGLVTTLLLIAVLSLLGIGIIMVYSTSSIQALQPARDEYHFLKRQAVFGCAGLMVLFVMARFPYQYVSKLTYPVLAACFAGLGVLMIPGVGVTIG